MGEFTAHGDHLETAIRDVRFKFMQSDFDPEELVASIKSCGTITFNEYRLLTGACESGLRHGLAEAGHGGVEEMPLSDALRLSRGKYGGEKLAELFQ